MIYLLDVLIQSIYLCFQKYVWKYAYHVVGARLLLLIQRSKQ